MSPQAVLRGVPEEVRNARVGNRVLREESVNRRNLSIGGDGCRGKPEGSLEILKNQCWNRVCQTQEVEGGEEGRRVHMMGGNLPPSTSPPTAGKITRALTSSPRHLSVLLIHPSHADSASVFQRIWIDQYHEFRSNRNIARVYMCWVICVDFCPVFQIVEVTLRQP